MNVLLVNLPTARGKRAHFGRLSFQRGTNYGLLAIASVLTDQDHDVLIFDPQALDDSIEPEKHFRAALLSRSWDLVGFSCLSGFSYPFLASWSAVAKHLVSRAYLIAGGQDHVGRIPHIVLGECSALDAVVCGEGELSVLALTQALNTGKPVNEIPGVATRSRSGLVGLCQKLSVPPSLHYPLYPSYKKFPASVEYGVAGVIGGFFTVVEVAKIITFWPER